MREPGEDDDDDQPSYREHAALTRPTAGLVQQGRFVSLASARRLGAASVDEIYPECPKCGHVWREPWINPFFTAAFFLQTGIHQPLYGQYKTCDACLTAIDAESAEAKAADRFADLQRRGFSLVQTAWTFETYPNQGSPWLRRARQYVGNPMHDILIYGNPGVGKTGLAIAIMRALWNNHKVVRVTRASELILALRGTDAAHVQAVLADMVDVDFLLLDDLSAMRRTEYWEEILNVIIDIRQQANRLTIMTANVHVSSKSDPSTVLSEFFGYVAYDRLVERGEFWNILGTSGRRAYGDRAPKTGQSAYEQQQRLRDD